jgi:hypothetical protein
MRINIAFLLLFMLVVLAGCYKDPLYNELSNNFTVTTNRDIDIDFSAFQTFYISDSVSYASDNPNDSVIVGADAKAVVDAIKNNMIARGYTFVARTSSPDLAINVGAIKNIDAGVVYPGWWGGYGGWYGGCYYGYCYPYYYPYPVTYVLTTGNVIVDMVDLKNATPKQKLEVIWNAWVGGNLSTTTSVNVQLTVDAINQAFKQSAYIQSN